MNKSTLEICVKDLYTDKEELEKSYTPDTVARVLRVREMYTWMLSNPEMPDKEFIREHRDRFRLSRVTAYEDLTTVRRLLPMIGKASREFHRWRWNEMELDIYRMAKEKKDLKAMVRAAADYARYNDIEKEDDPDLMAVAEVPQPFIPSSDPRVLGIEPIPNLRERINELIEKYSKDTIDIEDVEYEEADLEEDDLFPPLTLYGNDNAGD